MNMCQIGTAFVLFLSSITPLSTMAASVSGQGTWETTLQPRNLEGNANGPADAYYDADLGITWLADANYAGKPMYWADANAWAASLNINGNTGWRLPTVTDTNAPGCDFYYSGTDCGYNVDPAAGEMAHMFYSTLGNLSEYSSSGGIVSGWGLTNTGPFSNIQANYQYYWSATGLATIANRAWTFGFTNGNQYFYNETMYKMYAWAVQTGDVGVAISSVPIPATAWLFGSGLMMLVRMGRRKAA